ncbi:MAG: hypothetical protein HRU70_14065 [Phycisphaeraceae bacterium]|nr:MAG: hypothetical protein HRU70_14065 [Phycisphaeraceae bacterium]
MTTRAGSADERVVRMPGEPGLWAHPRMSPLFGEGASGLSEKAGVLSAWRDAMLEALRHAPPRVPTLWSVGLSGVSAMPGVRASGEVEVSLPVRMKLPEKKDAGAVQQEAVSRVVPLMRALGDAVSRTPGLHALTWRLQSGNALARSAGVGGSHTSEWTMEEIARGELRREGRVLPLSEIIRYVATPVMLFAVTRGGGAASVGQASLDVAFTSGNIKEFGAGALWFGHAAATRDEAAAWAEIEHEMGEGLAARPGGGAGAGAGAGGFDAMRAFVRANAMVAGQALQRNAGVRTLERMAAAAAALGEDATVALIAAHFRAPVFRAWEVGMALEGCFQASLRAGVARPAFDGVAQSAHAAGMARTLASACDAAGIAGAVGEAMSAAIAWADRVASGDDAAAKDWTPARTLAVRAVQAGEQHAVSIAEFRPMLERLCGLRLVPKNPGEAVGGGTTGPGPA